MTAARQKLEQLDASGPAALAATKFHPPARRHDALRRNRLLNLLKEQLPRVRLAIFSAPAGAGKTTLLAELPYTFPEMKWAWLLLDEEDNDPCRFAAALGCSLEQIDPSFSPAASANPMPGATAGLSVVTTLINNVTRANGEQIALVLDDFQVINEPSVYQALDYLLERLPPNMRVVVSSRYDPPISISKWRARGDLAELRLRDLTFTEEETAELVNSCLHISLSPDESRALYCRTEGWAAGLRLMATSMAQTPSDRKAVLQHGMEGRQRLFEFLLDEVLDRQSPPLRRFLLDTSVLPVLSKPFCDALTGRTDSHQVLDDLYRRNLFIVAADEAGLHFRYHDLFADFLKDRLRRERPEDWVSLHDRAAQVETEPEGRIHHWLIAENWKSAATEIERIGPDYMRRGFACTLRRWIDRIPAHVRRECPRLAYLLGASIWARNEFNLAQPHFEEALEGFRRIGDEDGQRESLVALSVTATNANHSERAPELFERALTFPLPPASCLEMHVATGWHAVSRRDWTAVRRSLDDVLDLIAQPSVPFNAFAMHLLFIGTSLPEFNDRLDRALGGMEEHIRSCSDLNRSCYHMLRAACRLFRGDTAEGRRAAAVAVSTVYTPELPLTVRLYNIVVIALAAYAEGAWERVESIIGELTDADSEALLVRNWRSIVYYFLGRARWLAGNYAGVEECCHQLPPYDPGESPQIHIHRLLLAGIRHLCGRSYAQADCAFREAAELEADFRLTAGHSSAPVLLAYTHLRRGHLDDAIDVFSPYVEVLEQLNGPGWLLRENPIVIPLLRLLYEKNRHRVFVERILQALGVPLDITGATGRETLSSRELEVLRVMAEGLSNREIGNRLFVSEATVKTHVQRILRKLDAASRTQAVARAREWMLL